MTPEEARKHTEEIRLELRRFTFHEDQAKAGLLGMYQKKDYEILGYKSMREWMEAAIPQQQWWLLEDAMKDLGIPL